MRLVLGNVLLTAAAFLLAVGCWAAPSLGRSLRQLFVAPRADASSWLLLGGLACALFGLACRVSTRDLGHDVSGAGVPRRRWPRPRFARARLTTRLP